MPIEHQPPDLASLRRQKGISLRQISDATKIGVRYLEAIEEGKFEKLPGGIYSTSYVRQYARAIEFDEADLLEYYYRKTGLAPDNNIASVPASPSGFRKSVTELLRRPLLRVLG